MTSEANAKMAYADYMIHKAQSVNVVLASGSRFNVKCVCACGSQYIRWNGLDLCDKK